MFHINTLLNYFINGNIINFTSNANIDNNIIPRNNKKYSWKNMENKNKAGKGASANVNNTFNQYEEKELEQMLREKQKDKFDNVQEFKPSFKI